MAKQEIIPVNYAFVILSELFLKKRIRARIEVSGANTPSRRVSVAFRSQRILKDILFEKRYGNSLRPEKGDLVKISNVEAAVYSQDLTSDVTRARKSKKSYRINKIIYFTKTTKRNLC